MINQNKQPTNGNPPGNFQLTELSDAEFESKVLKNPNPVYVLFYSPTCDLCADMTKTLNQIGIAFNGRLEFFRMNIHNNPAYSSMYAQKGMPCSVVFSEGSVVRSTRIMDGEAVWTGNAANLQYFLNWVNNVLNVINEK